MPPPAPPLAPLAPPVASALYPRLMGPAWHNLHDNVRRAHLQREQFRASGSFRIQHGPGRLAQIAARLLRLPPAADAVPTHLLVTGGSDREIWLRNFGAHQLHTMQRELPGAILAERFGLLEIRFRLAVENQSLRFDQVSSALRAGPLSLRIPRFLAPRIEALESRGERPNSTHVRVSVALPLAGLLISYEGEMTPEARA